MRITFPVMAAPFLALTLLSACAGTPAALPPVANPIPLGLDDTCDAASYSGVVGREADVLSRGFRPGSIRIIVPGQIASQDYQPERLTFNIGTDNRIRQITCG